MRGLFVLLTLLVASFAHAELNGEWVFEFSNGNKVFFSPERGAFFQIDGYTSAWPIGTPGRILRFESTGPNQFQGLGKATENGATARIIKSRKASLMFFAMPDGIFVMSENGVVNKMVEGSEIALENRDFYMEPGPEKTLSDGKKIRAVALRIPEGNSFQAAIDVVDSELKQGRRVSMTGLENHAGDWKFKIELLNPGTDIEIISYQIEAEGKHTMKRHYSRHWEQQDAFDLYANSAFRGRDSFYGNFSNQVHFSPVVASGSINTGQLEGGTRFLTDLVTQASVSTQPITKLVPKNLILAVQILGDELVRAAAVSGLLQYNPIDSKNTNEINNWIRESFRLKNLTQHHSYLLFQTIAGQSYLTFQPKGSGAMLEQTLSACNLQLGL